MKIITVNGYEELKSKLNKYRLPEITNSFFIYFTGTKMPDTGQSWCPDCVKASSIVDQALEHFQKNADVVIDDSIIFIICNVGFREEWKDPKNPIKADTSFDIKCIPTLIQYSVNESKTIEGRKLERDEDFVKVFDIVSFLKNN